MSTAQVGEVANQVGSSPEVRWIFSKEEMKKTASVKDGSMDEWQELQCRQQATRFIQTLSDKLNQAVKDKAAKISQLCVCAAMMHMHRFFYFHSFTFFDYRDIAAACLLLSGKSEECPRKLEHIVKAWWLEKFAGIRIDQQRYTESAQLIVTLENVILQTISFDFKVVLPHPSVLMHIQPLIKQDITNGSRKLTEVAYYFATDVLCVTSWGIRYSSESIAAAVIFIVCSWANYEIPAFIDGVRWYQKVDKNMTQELLDEMSTEFIEIYATCRSQLALKRFVDKGEVVWEPTEVANLAAQHSPSPFRATPGVYGMAVSSSSSGSSALLPPPPAPPPTLGPAKKVDMSEYRERKAQQSTTQPPRTAPVERKDGSRPPDKTAPPPTSHPKPSEDDVRKREREARERDKRKREHSMSQLNPLSDKRSRPSEAVTGGWPAQADTPPIQPNGTKPRPSPIPPALKHSHVGSGGRGEDRARPGALQQELEDGEVC